jgi:hypothetical protein
MSSFTHIANKVTEIERITKNLHEPHYSEVLQYYWRLHVSPYITMKLGMRPAGNGDLVVFTGARLEDADVSAVGLLKRPRVLLHVLQQVKKKKKRSSSLVNRWFILLLMMTRF